MKGEFREAIMKHIPSHNHILVRRLGENDKGDGNEMWGKNGGEKG